MIPTNKSNHSQVELSKVPPQFQKSKNSILEVKNISEVVVEKMKVIVQDNYDRMSSYSSTNSKPLSEGFFYANEYCFALTKTNQIPRLDFFKNKGAFYHGYLSPKHFVMEYSPSIVTNKMPNHFLLKDGIKSSEALKSVHTGISIIECGAACDIANYEAILDYLGEDKFNALLSKDQAVPFCIAHLKSPQPITELFLKDVNIKNLNDIKKGQFFGVKSADDYCSKHPYGEDQALNLICIDDKDGDKKFIGFGTSPEGISYEGVVNQLFEAYNKTPIKCDQILTKELAAKEVEIRINLIMNDMLRYQNQHNDHAKLGFLFHIKLGLGRELTSNEILSYETNLREFSGLYFQAMNNIRDTKQLSFDEFKKQGGGTLGSVSELDESRLKQLKKLSIPEGQKIIKVWEKQLIFKK